MLAATNKMQKGRSRLAIIYDERIISAPVVVGVLGAEITLVGFSSIEEAQAVSASLNKPLSTQLLIESLMPLAR
jgi:preprotein translocase subunit SecD